MSFPTHTDLEFLKKKGKIASLWEPLPNDPKKTVECKVCAHYCKIPNGKKGICRTRINVEGTLYTLVYGKGIHRGSSDPIEKKPLYHFYPGSISFSIATIGCNFHCKHCQNWEISQSFPDISGSYALFSEKDKKELYARDFPLTSLTPQKVVASAKKVGAKSIAYTYNEPTIWFEFVKDTALIAHQNNIKNVLVTNGFSSIEANKEFIQFIDAANIDFKAFNDSFYRKIVGVPSMQPVLETAKFLKKNKVHVEITNLLIPKENDNLEEIREMVKWIIANLGKDTPLHFSAYRPMYRLDNPSTPSQLLIKAWNIAREEGLYYVYMGNVLTTEGSQTYCHNCNSVLITRRGYSIKNVGLDKNNCCKKCGEKAHIIGNVSQTSFFDWW